MRKAVLDFIKLEDKPFLLSGHIDINAHLEEILKIYDQEGRDYKAILIGDINLLLLSYLRHKRALTTTALKRTSKEKSIIVKSWKRRPPFKTLRQTKGEHEGAMQHIEILLHLLIISTKGYGIYLSDSDLHGDELSLFENLKFEDGRTFPEMVKSIYGHKQPLLDNSHEDVPPGNDTAPEGNHEDVTNPKPFSHILELPIYKTNSKGLPTVIAVYSKLLEYKLFRDEIENEGFGENEFIHSVRRAYFGLDIYTSKTTATHLLAYFSKFFENQRKYRVAGAELIKDENGNNADPNHLINGKGDLAIKILLKELEQSDKKKENGTYTPLHTLHTKKNIVKQS